MIKVSNTEKDYVPVNEMTFLFNLSSTNYDYQQAINELNSNIEILTTDLQKMGYDNLEVINYSIREIYEKDVKRGYRGSATIELVLPYDQQELLRIVNMLSNSESNASFSLQFSNNQVDSLKNLLIDKAYKGALVKANILANSSGTEITGIEEMNLRDINYIPYRMAESSVQLAPQDIELQTTVEVNYNIRKKSQ
ncbi:SIMPL domain-containing protein [Mycoplasmatota bacterium WC44]